MLPYTTIIRLLFLLALPFTALAAQSPDAGVTRNPTLAMPAKPITTRAELDTYMRDTPSANSPLTWLTPGAQRRFLGSLMFQEHGLGGMSLDDLRYELTREQAYVLLQLFGAQSYALELDARNTPRPADEDQAASTLETAYDQWLGAAGQVAGNAGSTQAISRSYAAEFAPEQTSARLHALADRDVELLFRAATLAFHATSQPDYLADMRRDFAELQRRHRVDRPYASALYDALLVTHHTDEARALPAAYPSIERRPPPLMRTFNRIRDNQPSLWIATLSTHKRELVRFRFNTRAPVQIIVLASTRCRFSADAARDIEADPLLRDLFRGYAQWVAPASEVTAFDAVRDWNQAHPALRLGIAYDNASLPMAEGSDTPTFYFLNHGSVVDTVVGWPPGGHLDAIRRGLRKIDLLR